MTGGRLVCYLSSPSKGEIAMSYRERCAVHKIFVVAPQWTIAVIEDPSPRDEHQRWGVHEMREYSNDTTSETWSTLATMQAAVQDAERFHERASITDGRWDERG